MKKQILFLIPIVALLFLLQSCAKKPIASAMTQGENNPLTPAPAPAQEAPKQMLPPQVIVGAQTSSLPGESGRNQQLAGFQAGFSLPITRLNENVSFRAELNGSMQGANYENYGMKGRMSMFYINVPFVARYQTKSGLFVEGGIQSGFRVSAKDKFMGTTNNMKEFTKAFDFGIPIGVGYELKNNLGIGLRIIDGFTNINANNTIKDHNFVMALRGTYSIKGKKK